MALHELADGAFVCMSQADGEKLFKHFRPQFEGCDESLSNASALFCAFVFQKPPVLAPAGAPRPRLRCSHRRHAEGSSRGFMFKNFIAMPLNRRFVLVWQQFATHTSCCVCNLLASSVQRPA